MGEIGKFISDQLSVWPMAAANFRALKSARIKEVRVGDIVCKVQFNPCRIVSTTATTDPAKIAARPCFLCEEHRPAEQFHVRFEGRKGRAYNIQVNPFPIFPGHLVIASVSHVPQSIWRHFVDMLDFAAGYPEYTVFYNGPMSGASAPDHLHFQACPRGMMPLENAVDVFMDTTEEAPLDVCKDASLYHFTGYAPGVYCLRAATAKSMAKLMYRLIDCAPMMGGDTEPRLNLFTYCREGEYRAFVTLRSEVRSHHYFSTGEDHLTMSPGAADMAGYFVAPKEEDFNKVNTKLLEDMVKEVTITPAQDETVGRRLTRRQPLLDVGIMSSSEIVFEIISDGAGPQKVTWRDGRIDYNGTLYDELLFDEVTSSTMFAEPTFVLHDVVIGVDFHWQRKVTQKFAGSLKFIVEGDKITAVNRVGIEDYLLSVISSEMKASAKLEYLKAHAVISRSWVMAQMEHKGSSAECLQQSVAEDGTPVHVQWFGHSDHEHFDVCADDHCQRYQGLTMAVGENVRKAIDQTWGQVLTSEGKICDCRFSKCCGGTMELFSTCWEDTDYPYLKADPDAAAPGEDPFCHTSDKEVLAQVLNDYDLETQAFYEWEVRYGREEVSELIRRRSGIDFGTILDLEPIERGPSGRLKLLKVKGSKKTMIIGKELIIRRWLSESHLYSSAFDPSWEGDTLVLKGRGWGHGVGFCQIGAAVMAYKGYDYKQILEHYYPGSILTQND